MWNFDIWAAWGYYDSDRTVGYTEHNRGSQDGVLQRTVGCSQLAKVYGGYNMI